MELKVQEKRHERTNEERPFDLEYIRTVILNVKNIEDQIVANLYNLYTSIKILQPSQQFYLSIRRLLLLVQFESKYTLRHLFQFVYLIEFVVFILTNLLLKNKKVYSISQASS